MVAETTDAPQLYPDRRQKARLKQDASIEVRSGKKKEFATFPLIESTRHGARLVMSDNTKKNQGVDFVVAIGCNTFSGEARVAWTMPMTNGRAVIGLEFLTFRLRIAA